MNLNRSRESYGSYGSTYGSFCPSPLVGSILLLRFCNYFEIVERKIDEIMISSNSECSLTPHWTIRFARTYCICWAFIELSPDVETSAN
mmetsp:Transcript_16084/g.44501  ORF Transcript_16084/g.44501 Transcript_16084/m.44501 type:complete len:89 (+) Transcript_16084:1751-2017(+)